uniref:Uncharacterized protein n=1 Tax=Arundo donax TaxID=35708 RepID=A0A0A8ZCZ6_ARUDO
MTQVIDIRCRGKKIQCDMENFGENGTMVLVSRCLPVAIRFDLLKNN